MRKSNIAHLKLSLTLQNWWCMLPITCDVFPQVMYIFWYGVAKISLFENNNYTFGIARSEVCRERRNSEIRKCIKYRKSIIYRGSTHQNSFSGTLEWPNVTVFTAITLEIAKCSQTSFTRTQYRCLSTFPAHVNSISAATFRTTLHSSALYVARNLLLLLLYDGYINYITGTEDGIFKTRYRYEQQDSGPAGAKH